jgi:hypothetical protein
VSCRAACPPDCQPTTSTVGVANLRTRRLRGIAGEAAGDLFVTGTGTPAWLQGAADQVQVRAGTQVLDSGAIEGLAWRGVELSWTNGGQPRGATLR